MFSDGGDGREVHGAHDFAVRWGEVMLGSELFDKFEKKSLFFGGPAHVLILSYGLLHPSLRELVFSVIARSASDEAIQKKLSLPGLSGQSIPPPPAPHFSPGRAEWCGVIPGPDPESTH